MLLDFLPVIVQHEHYEQGKKRLYWFKSGYGKFNVLKWEQWHIKKNTHDTDLIIHLPLQEKGISSDTGS